MIPGLIVAVFLWVAVPVCVVERVGVFASLNRSATLISGNGWPVFGIIFLFGVIERAPEYILEKGFESGNVSLGAYVFVPIVISIFAAAAGGAVTAVGYHDLRVVKDGIDRERLLAVFD